MQYDKLFTPINIGCLTLKNRFVMAPMSVHMTEDGTVTPEEIAYTERRAAGGVAMIIVGSVCVHPDGDFGGQLYIESDERIAGLQQLTKVVHQHDCLIAAQIHHAGRETSARITGQQPVAPSYFVPEMYAGLKAEYDAPHVLTTDEVKEYIEYYAQAIRRAKEAGFDACELHCAHGYLICEFMSPLTNHRTDQYGGCFLGRMRFVTEIIQRSRELVGHGYPLMARIVGDELRAGGIDMALSVKIAQYLEALGIDALSVSADMYPFVRTVPNMYHKRGVNLYLADNVRAAVQIPVLAAGQLNRPEVQMSALEAGKADIICLGRALIADPDYPRKLQMGKIDEICYCIACNKGCHDRSAGERFIKCTMNVQAGREQQQEFQLVPTVHSKKVVIIGGGPSGMEAARVAALRGHKVVLLEKQQTLGGRLALAAVPPGKQGYQEACHYLIQAISQQENIHICLDTEATLERVQAEQPDAVLLASGVIPFIPPIKGLAAASYLLADEVLAGEAHAGDRVAIIGGGAIGAELAHYLIEQQKREIYVLEMREEIASDLPQDSRICLLHELQSNAVVHLLPGAKVTEVQAGQILYEDKNGSGQLQHLDTIILAAGARPNRLLEETLRHHFSQVYVIGDATRPKDLVKAIYEGYQIAAQL